MRMRQEIGYPPSIHNIQTLRTLSLHELCSLPKGTLVWLERYGLVEFIGQGKRTYTPSCSVCSFYFDENKNVKTFNLQSDLLPIPYACFSFIQRVDYYRLYYNSNYNQVFELSWDDVYNRGAYLLEDKHLNKILEPYMPLLDCFSSALQINKDLKAIP